MNKLKIAILFFISIIFSIYVWHYFFEYNGKDLIYSLLGINLLSMLYCIKKFNC